MFTRPPALQKQDITIPGFRKWDWETLSRPCDELGELRQTRQTQLCPHPWNTAGLTTAATDLFKQSKDFLSDISSVMRIWYNLCKHSACTLTGPTESSLLHNPRGEEESRLPSAFSLASCCWRPARPQHKCLQCGGCSGGCCVIWAAISV